MAAIASAIWTDKSGSPRLEFSMSQDGMVVADFFQKNLQDEFENTGLRINERSITIETENISALLRGILQKTFYLNELNREQKKAVLGSLQNRNIEIMRGHNQQGSMVIHALP